jgi:hypothetical protein
VTGGQCLLLQAGRCSFSPGSYYISSLRCITALRCQCEHNRHGGSSELADIVFVEVIRALVACGEIDQAMALFEERVPMAGLTPSSTSPTVNNQHHDAQQPSIAVVYGFFRQLIAANEWKRIFVVLDRIHKATKLEDVSRGTGDAASMTRVPLFGQQGK